MTPAELKALADAATPGPGDTPPHSWTGARAGEKMIASARLIALAPDLARLCADLGEALEEIADAAEWLALYPEGAVGVEELKGEALTNARTVLAKLSELEVRT